MTESWANVWSIVQLSYIPLIETVALTLLATNFLLQTHIFPKNYYWSINAKQILCCCIVNYANFLYLNKSNKKYFWQQKMLLATCCINVIHKRIRTRKHFETLKKYLFYWFFNKQHLASSMLHNHLRKRIHFETLKNIYFTDFLTIRYVAINI